MRPRTAGIAVSCYFRVFDSFFMISTELGVLTRVSGFEFRAKRLIRWSRGDSRIKR